MRNGQNKRMRGRNRRGHNPLTRVYESNGPDVKIRGTAHHIAEKYLQLARDAQTSGDPVAGEGYLQHAEHYFRLIAVAQAQFAPQQQHNPNQPQQPYQRPDMESRDDFEDDGDDMGGPDSQGQPYPSAPPQQMQQPMQQPTQQPRPQHQNQPQQNYQGYQQQQPRNDEPRDPGLPAFITGGGGQAPAPAQGNGYDNEQGGDRDNRRFHRGGRNRRFNRGGRNDYDQQRGPGGGDAQAQNAPADAQPTGEFSPPKPSE